MDQITVAIAKMLVPHYSKYADIVEANGRPGNEKLFKALTSFLDKHVKQSA